MRAVQYTSFRDLPTVRSLPDPACAPDGVVIQVVATGLCRSDWHGWMGHDSDITVPHVPGHEFAGTIAAIGSEVRRWRVGDRVTAPFVCACGHCASCRRGDQQVCENQSQPGFTHWGSFAELVAIRHAEENLVALPDGLDDVTAALLGCRFATSYRAVVAQGAVHEGQWLAVHGCGGVGLSAVMIAASRGARVIAVDITEDALALAASIGAEVMVNASTTDDVAGTIREITGGGADISLDALGSAATCMNSIRSLRRRGRHIQIGLIDEQQRPTLPTAEIVSRELEIVGSHGMAAHTYPSMLADVASGLLHPQALVAARLSLDEAPAALARMGTEPPTGVAVIVL